MRVHTRSASSTVWNHSNGLSDYQVWTGYRIASGQLNFNHSGRHEDNSRKKLLACRGCKETMEHLFWGCTSAAALWAKLVAHLTGKRASGQRTYHFFEACASRQVHYIPLHRNRMLADQFLG